MAGTGTWKLIGMHGNGKSGDVGWVQTASATTLAWETFQLDSSIVWSCNGFPHWSQNSTDSSVPTYVLCDPSYLSFHFTLFITIWHQKPVDSYFLFRVSLLLVSKVRRLYFQDCWGMSQHMKNHLIICPWERLILSMALLYFSFGKVKTGEPIFLQPPKAEMCKQRMNVSFKGKLCILLFF